MKCFFDFTISLAALLLLFPLLALIAVQVRRMMDSPVLFRQTRPGLHCQPFQMIKFRTITNTCGEDGALLPEVDRLTNFGRFLRSTSLDELPELWNVLKGEMSLVGPRSLLMDYLPLYSLGQARRHEVKPGITGWARVNGRNAISWEDKFKLDVWYLDHQSFWLDLKNLFLTVKNVIARHGTSADGEATMPKFSGNN